MASESTSLKRHPVVPHQDWLAARMEFLAKEKEFTRLRDELSRQRRELPWEAVPKEYVFEGPGGKQTLAQLFDGKSQLIVYHFMFAPEWEQGCEQCSHWADTFNGIPVHLRHRDVSFVAISRAPLPQLEAFKKRMGWTFKWVSSFPNEFNFDYYASFTPQELESGGAFYNYRKGQKDSTDREAVSVFYKDERGAIFHTYSCYARGIDLLNATYNYLDLAPKGRDEAGIGPGWVKHHDRYGE